MSDKPRWEKWKGETREQYEDKLLKWYIDLIREIPIGGMIPFIPGEENIINEAKEIVLKERRRVIPDGFKHCKVCSFYVPEHQVQHRGECFRFPGITKVSELHWCGEFKGK